MKVVLISLVAIAALTAWVYFPNYQNRLHHFDQQEEYNPKLAYDLASYATTSYCDPAKLAYWQCGTMCDKHPEMSEIEVIHFEKDQATDQKYRDGLAYIGWNAMYHSIVLVFRGTISLSNVKDDAQTQQKNYHLCETFGISACDVHLGFYETFNSISEGVFKALEKKMRDHPDGGLIITGHSLGGAMAMHAAVHIQVFYYQKAFTLYTFGAPRVGDRRFFQFFKTIFKGTHYRITNYRDPVPHAPLQKQGFIHEPTEVYYYDKVNKSKYIVCNNVNEDPNCSNKFLIDIAPGKDFTNTMDHMWYLGYDMTKLVGSCMAKNE